MLIGDDDDDVLEEAELDFQRGLDEEEAPAVSTDASDVVEDVADLNDVSLKDFELLPYVEELVKAHHDGDAQAADRKMAELRRAVRRAEGRLAALQHSVSGPVAAPDAAQSLLSARTDLLARTRTTLAQP